MKRSGLSQTKLLEMYNTIIRPAIEYSAVVYHSMITKELGERLEAMQRQPMQVIYGYEDDIRQVMEDKGVDLSEDRRNELVLRFALKNEKSPKYGQKWFTPMRTE